MHKRVIGNIPFVFQYNKRDLRTRLTINELNTELNLYNSPYTCSIASKGSNIIETFELCSQAILIEINPEFADKLTLIPTVIEELEDTLYDSYE